MTNAKKDNNQVSTEIGVLNSNGSTPTLLEVNPTSHAVIVHDGTTGSDAGNDLASHDDNSVTTLIVASESDGTTPVTLFINSSGQLLVDSN